MAGICHRRGPNAELPGGWIPCFRVASVEQAISEALAKGGKQLCATREVSQGSFYAVIEDMKGHKISVIDFPAELRSQPVITACGIPGVTHTYSCTMMCPDIRV